MARGHVHLRVLCPRSLADDGQRPRTSQGLMFKYGGHGAKDLKKVTDLKAELDFPFQSRIVV